MKKRNLFFLFSIIFVLLVIAFCSCHNIFLYGLNYFSIIENREFAHFEDVKISNFFNKELQVNLENSLSDQFFNSDKLRIRFFDNLLFIRSFNCWL